MPLSPLQDDDAVEGSFPAVTVVVPTYRRLESLERFLRAIERQTLQPSGLQVILVDDNSGPPWTDDIDKLAARSSASVTVLHAPENGGAAAARNLGWRSSRSPVIAFTDDDCVPDPGWLAAGLYALEANADIGVVQGRTVRARGRPEDTYNHLTVLREVLAPSPWFEGCNLFFRREALEQTGGFDEGFRYYGEDTSLGWSVVDAGWGRGWAEEAVVEHEVVDRSWRWHLKIHLEERHLVRLVARHPGMRTMFWRPWAVKRENALFALAVFGLGLGRRSRRGLLMTVPYLLWLSPAWRQRRWKAAALQVAEHSASLGGKLVVGLKCRTLLL